MHVPCTAHNSVEKFHNGTEDNIVLYISAGPDCALNRDYVEKMRGSFERGATPPDFPVNAGKKEMQCCRDTSLIKRKLGLMGGFGGRLYENSCLPT